jgi:hypothetical protein
VSSGRRITVGLVGLVLLVVIGWLVKDLTHHAAAGSPAARLVTVSATQYPTSPVSYRIRLSSSD